MRDDSQKPTMLLGLRLVFGLSLAVNLLIAGAVLGAWLRHDPPGRDFDTRSSLGRILYKELPPEDRRALRRDVRQRADRQTQRRANVTSDLYEALQAEPFEPEAIQRLMERQAQAQQAGQAALRAGWLEILSEMTPAERIAYAERLRVAARARLAPQN